MKHSFLSGFIIGSIIMVLAVGPLPYWSEHGFPVGWGCFGLSVTFIAPMIAGFVSASGTDGDVKDRLLSGVLPAIPAVSVYGYLLDVAHIGDGIILPFMFLFVAGFGATGGAISILLK